MRKRGGPASAGLALLLASSFVSSTACAAGDLTMRIALTFEKPALAVDPREGRFFLAMGQEMILAAEIVNPGPGPLEIEDPDTSQGLILRVLAREENELTEVALHPGSVDRTGEWTAPMVEKVVLKPGEARKMRVRVQDLCPDKVFLPGEYEIALRFDDDLSPPARVQVGFRPESVPLLVRITVDERADPWTRESALEWLQRLPFKPDLALPAGEETGDALKAREASNRTRGEAFLKEWERRKGEKEIRDFFDKQRP